MRRRSEQGDGMDCAFRQRRRKTKVIKMRNSKRAKPEGGDIEWSKQNFALYTVALSSLCTYKMLSAIQQAICFGYDYI